MLTGKNLEEFNKWLEDYSEKDQSVMNKELDIYPDEIFNKLPFEMQLGVYLAYFRSKCFTIEHTIDKDNGIRTFSVFQTKNNNIGTVNILTTMYLMDGYKTAIKIIDDYLKPFHR